MLKCAQQLFPTNQIRNPLKATQMKTSIKHIATLALISLPCLLATQAASAANISRTDYVASKSRIADDYKADKKNCASNTGNALDICQAQAKSKDKVALAELEFSYTGKRSDQDKILSVKADMAYDVAREECDDKAGNDKSICITQAKAVKTKAMTDLKMGQRIGDARTDARQDKRDADYKVASEKCDALAGNAKTACMTDAKARAGKS